MAVSGVNSSTTNLVARDPKLNEIIEVARAIVARPGKPEDDRSFVKQVLGKTHEEANSKRRSLLQTLHTDRLGAMGATPDEIALCKDAFDRVHSAWTATKTAGKLPPTKIELAARKNNGIEGVLSAAADIANKGVRAARETIQRKFDDGTVDALASKVGAAAGDIFELTRNVGRGWFDAVRKPTAKKD